MVLVRYAARRRPAETRGRAKREMPLIIRTATLGDAAAIAAVHVASWHTTYPGLVPDEHLKKLTVEARIPKWQETLGNPKPGTYDLVAENELGQIAGFIDGGPERSGDPEFKSELYAIYLLQSVQRKGLGRRLTHELTTRLLNDGWTSLMVWVLDANPSKRFYEYLGGKRVRDKRVKFGGVDILEVAYGWMDLRLLHERSRIEYV